MSKIIESDILIIGAGFAGLSTAYHLGVAEALKVVVLDREKAIGIHASGNNAGMARQAIADPYIARLAKEGRNSLKQCRWRGLKRKIRGSLLLARGEKLIELERTRTTLRGLGIACQRWSPKRARQRVPILNGGHFSEALFCPSDCVLDPQALLQGFFDSAVKKGMRFFGSSAIHGIDLKNGCFTVQTQSQIFRTRRIVNACGGWAQPVAKLANASCISLKAYRRHLFESRPLGIFDDRWPFVWDLDSGFYFRPMGSKRLLLSGCDKQLPMGEKHTQQMKAEADLLEKLGNFSDGFKNIRFLKCTSGLRTMAEDDRFVIGEDPILKNFFWVAGLGGHGLTTSFSSGRFAANLILGKKVDPELKKVLSPGRFAKAEGRMAA